MGVNKKLLLKTRIVSNKNIKGSYWRCVLEAPGIAASAIPGQFVNIRISPRAQPLLRRPFSVHGVSGSKLEIMYQVLGEGTSAFSKQAPGSKLDIIGPLGNGFTVPACGEDIILVAGGMGVAPLVFLARRLKGKNALVLIGSKNKADILCEKDFIDAGCSVKIATDDGSRGFKGYVSALLEKELLPLASSRPVIYACGPRPMLKEVRRTAVFLRMRAQLSLEEHMACGIGACLGCVVNTRSGFKRVCKEGPVFEADELAW